MKRTLLAFFTFLLWANLFAANTVLLDFESGTVPVSVSQWLNYSTGGTSSTVWSSPNPSPSDPINSTVNCYQITKQTDDPYWTGLEVSFATAIPITSDNQYLHVLVYKTENSRIALTYTPEGGAQSSDLWQTNNVTGAWIDYVLPVAIGTNLKTISVKIGDAPGVYYFDQIFLSDTGTALSPTEVSIDPAIKKQLFQGWGGSLCWWANMVGAYPDARIKTVCDWITDPVNGLNMNIFRFNIGGGDDPTHSHMRSDGGAMPGYKASATDPYDWTQDANQRKVLKQLIASRISKAGVNDIKLVAFSNSPPFWMTRSGCSAGSTEGDVTNLKTDMYDDFADYLTEVVKYYHDSLDITFDYLEPFNEPDSKWWKALGGQEGCFFSRNNQISMIQELYNKLSAKEMLSYCRITASDANSMDECYASLKAYENYGGILDKVSLISTHSYGGERSGVADFAKTHNMDVWQSESGPLYIGGTENFQLMTMSDRIIKDINGLQCRAWIDWQLAGTGTSPLWALIVGDYDNMATPFSRAISFYLRAQYSRYIKAGYTIIYNSAENVLTAVSPDETKLIIVISNNETYGQKFEVDLSKFSNFGKVQQIRTRAQASLDVKNSLTLFNLTGNTFTYDALSESVATFVVPINQQTSLEKKNTVVNDLNVFVSNGIILVKHPDEKKCRISIYDMLGQCVSSTSSEGSQSVLSTQFLHGFYIVRAEIDGKVYARKIRIS